MTTRTFTLAALSFGGMLLGGVTTALIAPRFNPQEGFVVWPLLLIVLCVTAMLFVGREYILPEVLAKDALTSFLTIIGLVAASQIIAFAATLSLNLALNMQMRLVQLIWFVLLWCGVNVIHRFRYV